MLTEKDKKINSILLKFKSKQFIYKICKNI